MQLFLVLFLLLVKGIFCGEDSDSSTVSVGTAREASEAINVAADFLRGGSVFLDGLVSFGGPACNKISSFFRAIKAIFSISSTTFNIIAKENNNSEAEPKAK